MNERRRGLEKVNVSVEPAKDGRRTRAARLRCAGWICEYAGTDPLYVFVRGNDNYLHMCHLDSGATTPVWVLLNM